MADSLMQVKDILSIVPDRLSNSYGFLPGFVALDLAFSWAKAKMAESVEEVTPLTQLGSHVLMGTLNTARQAFWNNYAGDEGSGSDAAMYNLKQLPQNVAHSWPFIGGYAFIDWIFERVKTSALSGMDPGMTKETLTQALIGTYDAANILYWDNYVPAPYTTQ